MKFVLYIDESGLFVRSRSPTIGLGVRVVGGVWFPWTEQSESTIAHELDEALDGWSGERHALNMRSAIGVGFALRNAAKQGKRLSPEVEGLARQAARLSPPEVPGWAMDRSRSGKLTDHGNQYLSRALRVIATLKGTVALAMEDDQRPDVSRYPSMGVAIVTRALIELAATQDDATLHLVVAAGGGGTEWLAELPPIADAVSHRFGRAVSVAPPLIADARNTSVHPGLFLADAVTHVYGPRGTQDRDLTSEQRSDWNTTRMQGQITSRCGNVPLALASGLLQPVVEQWLRGDLDESAIAEALRRARGPGHLPVVVDDLRRALSPRQEDVR